MRITADMIFAKSLDWLQSKGVDAARLTAKEIFDLAEAAKREADPFRDVNADAAGIPVKVTDGVWLWRLTIGASIWLDEVAEPLFGGGPEYRLALVYALIHAREPDAFRVTREKDVRRAVRETLARVCATPEEINAALDVALGLRPETRARDTAQSAVDFAHVAARLETQTGIPAAEWIWGRSASYALLAYNDLHDFAAAYAGAKPNHLMDELDRACNRRRALLAGIVKRVNG